MAYIVKVKTSTGPDLYVAGAHVRPLLTIVYGDARKHQNELNAKIAADKWRKTFAALRVHAEVTHFRARG